MAWEWVAPTATLASGSIGMWFTYKTARNQLSSQLSTLTKQLDETHNADLIKTKRQLYGDYLGALNEASFVAAQVSVVRNSIKLKNEEVNSKVQGIVADTVSRFVPDELSVETREEVIRLLIIEVNKQTVPEIQRNLREKVEESFKKLGLASYFTAIDTNRLLSLCAQVEIVAGPKVSTMAHKPILLILHESTQTETSPETSEKYRVQVAALRAAMREELLPMVNP